MKIVFLLLFVSFGGSLYVHAQSTTVSDTFQLGTRKVRVPPPEGFIDTATKFDRVVQRLATTEDPRNEAMASYVAESLVSQLTENQNIDLPLYAKFSVPRSVKAVDCSLKDFADVVTGFKAVFPQMLDPNSKISKEMNANLARSFEELWGKNVSGQVAMQKNLGFFQDGENVFSFLVAINMQTNEKTLPILASGSILRVNQRIFFLYVFKITSSKEDVDPMIERTKKWTAAVIAANK